MQNKHFSKKEGSYYFPVAIADEELDALALPPFPRPDTAALDEFAILFPPPLVDDAEEDADAEDDEPLPLFPPPPFPFPGLLPTLINPTPMSVGWFEGCGVGEEIF